MKIFFLLTLLCLVPHRAAAQPVWITNASGVKARATPAISGSEVVRLPIGTVLSQIAPDPRAGQVGGQQDFWYHVALPNGKDGWIFGTFLIRFEEQKRGEIYRKIAASKIKAEEAGYAELADLSRFLDTAVTEISDRTTLAELELSRLLAIQKTFEKIPAERMKQPEFQRFIKAHQTQAVYSEPGSIWLVKAELFWKLQKKYADLPIGEQIAWEAANLPLPGECETDDTCQTTVINATKGRYLTLYPTGKHAEAALNFLIETFEGINEQMKNVQTPRGNSTEDRQIRKEALAAIAGVRASLAKVTHPKKTKLIQLLTRYEKNYQVTAKS